MIEVKLKMLLKFIEEDKVKRVLYIHEAEDTVILVGIHSRKNQASRAELEKCSYKSIIDKMIKQEIEVLTEDPFDRRLEMQRIGEIERMERLKEEKKVLITGVDREESDKIKKFEERRQERDFWYDVVTHIVNMHTEPGCYFEDKARLIKEAAEIFNVNRKKIYRYLNLYLQSGKRKDSLYTYINNVGTNKNRKITKKLGAKTAVARQTGIDQGINMSEEIEKHFRIAVYNIYENKRKHSFAAAHRWLISTFYAEEDKKSKEDIRAPYKKPSIDQFRTWYKTKYRVKSREIIAREGEKTFSKDYRGLEADSLCETYGPGHIYQIDATIADIWLVSRVDRSQLIGRPVVYIGIDVFSRMITSVFICLEGPSYIGAMSLIQNMIEDKVEFCKQYGISLKVGNDDEDDDRDEWPSKGIPLMIIPDRGELISPQTKNVIEGLGITVENTPSYRGDAKGIVEQCFRVLNKTTIEWLPGYIQKQFKERGDQDYRLDAKLDIEEFTRIIINTIVHRNNSVLQNYVRTPEMIEDDVPPIPVEIWKWGMRRFRKNLQDITEEERITSLLTKPKSASMSDSGILIDGLLYFSNEKDFKDQMVRARSEGREKLDVRIDKRNLDVAYCIDKEKNKIIPCYLSESFTKGRVIKGMTYEEYKIYQENEKVSLESLKGYQDQKNKEHTQNIENLNKQAEKSHQETKNSTKNISENRRNENSDFRKKQAIQGESTYKRNTEEKVTETEKEDSPLKDRLRKKMQAMKVINSEGEEVS